MFVALRYPYTCVASGSGSEMSKGRGGAALRLNDFSLIYSPFAAGVCIALTPTLGQNQRAADRRANYRAFRVLRGKKFITLISIKLYSSYCREVWGSSIKQQFLQGSEVRMREASNRYYRKGIVKRATEQKLVVSQHTTATATAAAVRPRTKNYHQKKTQQQQQQQTDDETAPGRELEGILYKMEDERINRASRR